MFCQQATETARPAWMITPGDFGLVGTLTYTNFPTQMVKAKPIFVAYQSTDQALLAAATMATATRTRATYNSTSAPVILSSGLSGGAIAGVTVGTISAAFLGGLATFLMLRFCFGYRAVKEKTYKLDLQPDASLGAEKRVGDTRVDGWPRPELPPQHQSAQAHELASSGQTMGMRHELGNHAS